MEQKDTKIKIREYDDWIKIWINGELVIQNHTVETYDIAKRLCDLAGFDLDYEWVD